MPRPAYSLLNTGRDDRIRTCDPLTPSHLLTCGNRETPAHDGSVGGS